MNSIRGTTANTDACDCTLSSTVPLGRLIEQIDGMLRQWPAACISLLVVAVLLAAAFLAG